MSEHGELPTYAQALVKRANTRGIVETIQVRPARREPTVEVEVWDLESAVDHARSAARAVTLFQFEHLAVISSLLGRPVDFARTRRNLCIRGFNLEVGRGSVIEVGDAQLGLTGRCHPCARMEEAFGTGGFAAMLGHGGWTARIVQTGTIRCGDAVQLRLSD